MNKYSLYDIFKKHGHFVNEAVEFYSQKNKTICVYHLTGNKGEVNDELDKTALSITGGLDSRGNEFKPGGGDHYGRGLYTCYKLNKRIAHTYGNTLLEFKVPVQNFLVFVDDEAKAIHGENASLDKQFLSILERKGIDYQSNEKFKSIIEKFCEHLKKFYEERIVGTSTDKSSRTGPICRAALFEFSSLTKNKIKLKHLVDGVMFFGSGDGPVCVVFNTQLAAINRIGKVKGEDVEIFDRPSQIGIDDFDTKTFNQLRRLYSAKSGKGSKEWREHQKLIVDTLNQNIGEFTVAVDEINKEFLEQLMLETYQSSVKDKVSSLLNDNLVNLPSPDFKESGFSTEEMNNKAFALLQEFGDHIFKELKIGEYISLNYEFSRKIDEIQLSMHDTDDILCEETFEVLSAWMPKHQIVTRQMMFRELKESLVWNGMTNRDQWDDKIYELTDIVIKIFTLKRDIFDFIYRFFDTNKINILSVQKVISESNYTQLKELAKGVNREAYLFGPMSESESSVAKEKIINAYNQLMKSYKKLIFDDFKKELYYKILSNYKKLETNMSPNDIIKKIFVPFSEELDQQSINFEEDFTIGEEEILSRLVGDDNSVFENIFNTDFATCLYYKQGYEFEKLLTQESLFKDMSKHIFFFPKSIDIARLGENVKEHILRSFIRDRFSYYDEKLDSVLDWMPQGTNSLSELSHGFSQKHRDSLSPHKFLKPPITQTNFDYMPDIK